MNNEELKKRIETLEKWKEEKTRQQIDFPLDFQSQKILSNYFMQITDILNYTVMGAAEHFVTIYGGKQGQIQFQVNPVNLFPYTVNITTNVLTISGKISTEFNSFSEERAVGVTYEPDGSAPNPLVINTTYYVKNSNGLSFQLSATPGGAAINITNVGTLRQFIFIEL